MWPLHTSATDPAITLRRLSQPLIGCLDHILPSDWLALTPLTPEITQDGGRLTLSRSWWHEAHIQELWSELMIIAIIIFLRPKVVQSINQMLISRCAWFIGRATNWAFYQETKCGNTEIPYILFIQKNLGLFMALATITDYTFTIKIIAMLLKYFWGCHCTGSANKCHQKGINWLAMDGAGNKINDIKNVFHVPKDTLADCSNTFHTDPRHVLVLFALSLGLVGKWVKLVCWFFVKQNN